MFFSPCHIIMSITKFSEEKAKEWLDKLRTENKGAYPYVKKLVDKKYNK